MLNTPFSPWPSYSEEEADAVKQVLLSNQVNYWTGERCKRFEKEFAHWVGTEYAIALANGTLALELILKCMDLGPGDEVIVTARSFIASVSSVIHVGAKPVFADVDPNSQNITPETIDAVLTPKTKAILCVHLAGWPCDMDGIMALAKAKKLRVIEDCAQAHGAQWRGQSVGSFGDAAAWSFCQDKIMTTGGEGGMVTSNDHALWEKMWAYKDHGKSWEAVYQRQHAPGFRWLHEGFGSNFRMMEMQAVLGLIQLKKMPEWHQKRIDNARQLWQHAQAIPGLRVPTIPLHCVHAAYKCYVFVVPELLKKDWNRDRILQEINKRGVPCYSGSCSEIYLEKAFESTDCKPKDRLPVAKELGETSLMFLVHPTLTKAQLDQSTMVLQEVMAQAVA